VAARFAVVNSGENGEHSETLDEVAVKSARHNLRGRINALKLCVSAFEVLETSDERLEFLEMMDEAADKMVTALDDFEALTD
jgi:uncharacterized protein (DUF1810 family)